MRSAHFKMSMWSIAILGVALAAFIAQSRIVSCKDFDEDGPIRRDMFRQFNEAKSTYELGGRTALAAYLNAESGAFPGVHLFLTADGKDLLTGADRSRTFVKATGWRRYAFMSPSIRVIPSVSSQYALLVLLPAPNMGVYLPFYYLIAGVVIVLWSIYALQFVAPLKTLKDAVVNFGSGDLAARVQIKRKDEFGDLSRAFNEMASRIERLLMAERRLLQDISHEIKSPLARLRFAVALTRTSEDRFAAAARADKEVDRIAGLVEAVLQITRAEADSNSQHLEPVALCDFMAELMDDSKLEADAAGCQLKLQVFGDVVLNVDRELLRRALENILRNAIRHAPPSSSVDIDISRNPTELISIRDYGSGVPEEDLTNIFKPFFRIDTSRDKLTGGVGLGLAIVQRAVRVVGGTVWAENAQPGLRVFVEFLETS